MSDERATNFRPGQRIRASRNFALSILVKKETKQISIHKDQLGIFVRYGDIDGECKVNFDGVGEIEASNAWITGEV
jgi:hypothetical protein